MSHRKIHCYAASFGHDLAKELIVTYGTPGALVVDPFAGSGTTLVEALNHGLQPLGIDVDPIACLICRVETRSYFRERLVEFESSALHWLQDAEESLARTPLEKSAVELGVSFQVSGYTAHIPNNPDISHWFSETQRATLATLTAYANGIEDATYRDVFSLAISSAIIRKWPNTLSLAMDIDHSRPHRVEPVRTEISDEFKLFRRILRWVVSALGRRTQNWDTVGTVIQGDSSEVLTTLEAGAADLVLTSPPYVNAIDYPRAHKFAEWWLSPETKTCKPSRYIGLRGGLGDNSVVQNAFQLAPVHMQSMEWLRENHASKAGLVYRYVNDMGSVVSGCRHVLRDDGRLAFVLADNRVGGKVVPVVGIVTEMLERMGFTGIVVRHRTIQNNRRRYPFGFNGIMQSEAIITATKAALHDSNEPIPIMTSSEPS